MFVVHGTREFLDRVAEPTAVPVEHPTTLLGNWYATALFWKPQVAWFVNESTLLPVLLPLAPAATVLHRLRAAVATVLEAHAIGRTFIEHEVAEMSERHLATTSNRSVVGIMNEFAFLGGACRLSNGVDDLVALSLRLAESGIRGPVTRRSILGRRLVSCRHGANECRDPGPDGTVSVRR